MALSEDQKAMLRLLAQRGEQGYEDIAALKGLSVDAVRVQVREAVRQMEDEGLPPPALPLDPQAPNEPAAPAAPKPPPPAAPAPPEQPKAKPEPQAPTAGGPTATKRERPRLSLPADPGARGALFAGVLVVVALVLVLILSGGDDSGDGGSTTASDVSREATTNDDGAPVANSKELTKAVLAPVDGSDAAGVAVFGRIEDRLALLVEANGLEPTAKGEAYAIWLAQSPQRMLPMVSTAVNKSGKIGAQFEVPVDLLGYLANESFKQIAITLVDSGTLKTALAKATKEKKSPDYTGTEILRGTVTGPIVGAASR